MLRHDGGETSHIASTDVHMYLNAGVILIFIEKYNGISAITVASSLRW
jgi:hypothetical protein